MVKILATGGMGFIGSHTVVELLSEGYEVVVVDNLSNSTIGSKYKIEEISGKKIDFCQLDIRDKQGLTAVFDKHKIDVVVHFAGLKAVGESNEKPLEYYDCNIYGTIVLLEVMREYGCQNIIFSSSATVYGVPKYLPLDEKHELNATNPYGRTKLFIEEMLRDVYHSDAAWNIVLLRYFNPAGAHPSGKMGEDPNGIPNNLMPYIAQVATKVRPHLNVFGDDYATKDGTGIRDYIHVVDLAKGHTAAVKQILGCCGYKVYNLGTGNGYSVLEMVSAFEKASGVKIEYKIAARRKGDVASCYAVPDLAKQEMDWAAELGLDSMCQDHWNFQSKLVKAKKAHHQ